MEKNGIFLSDLKTLTVTPQSGDLFQAEFQHETFNFKTLPYDVDTGQPIPDMDTGHHNGDYPINSMIYLSATPSKTPYVFSHFEDELGNNYGDIYSSFHYTITQDTTWKAMYKKSPWLDVFVQDKDTLQIYKNIQENPMRGLLVGDSTSGYYSLPLGYRVSSYEVYEADYTNPVLLDNPTSFTEWQSKSNATLIDSWYRYNTYSICCKSKVIYG